MLNCGTRHAHVLKTVKTFVEQVKKSKRTPLLTCLLEGPSGSGKTALAASIGIDSGFPFIKIVSAENMIGLQESTKCAMITKVFEDSYKSPLSIIILDDIERLLEFVSIGPRFSNVILQTILVLLKRIPPKGRKLLVIGTSSLEDKILESMTLLDTFNVDLNVPNLKPSEMKQVLEEIEVFDPADIDDAVTALGKEIPIKRLLMLIEMAAQGGDKGVSDHQEYEGNQEYEGHQEHEGKEKIKLDYFYECLHGINI
jgi:vesicle-fusing ATPase